MVAIAVTTGTIAGSDDYNYFLEEKVEEDIRNFETVMELRIKERPEFLENQDTLLKFVKGVYRSDQYQQEYLKLVKEHLSKQDIGIYFKVASLKDASRDRYAAVFEEVVRIKLGENEN
ncbi:MAG: hypothetical protein AAF530_17795 [Pseudomonadota bacterium]